ncbi:hypothetical protein HDU84_008572 [Entophlyctis sp. JEL0112]|nr:hypothetical protein HDU84_008572 [Entophlyctis sp. JEL0112]
MESSQSPLHTALAAIALKETHDLAPKLKALEDSVEPNPVSRDLPFVIRVDAVAFSTFTQGIVKPFDVRLKDAMVATAVDLFAKFQPVLAYHHSDEISLVYNAATSDEQGNKGGGNDAVAVDGKKRHWKHDADTPRQHMYSGRVQKLASVVSSYASARLNFHLSKCDWSDRPPSIQARMIGHEAYFDGRVCPVPDMKTAMECIFWRSNFDGIRNSISGIAQSHFSHKELHNKNLYQMISMLETMRSVNLSRDYGPKFLFGTWIKKEEYTVPLSEMNLSSEVLERIQTSKRGAGMDANSLVTRRRIRTGSFNWADYSAEDRESFVASKFWPTGPSAPPMDHI